MASFCLSRALSLLREEDMAFSLFDDGDDLLVWVDGTARSYFLLMALERYPFYSKKRLTFHLCYLEEGISLPPKVKEAYEALGFTLTTIPCSYVLSALETHGKSKETSSSLRRHLERQAALTYLSQIHGNKLLLLSTLKEATNAYFKHQSNADAPLLRPKEKCQNKNIIRPFLFFPSSLMERWEKEIDTSFFLSPLPFNSEENTIDSYRQTTEELFPTFTKRFVAMMKNGDFVLEGIHPSYISSLDPTLSYWPVLTADDLKGTSFASRKSKEDERDFILFRKEERIGEFAYRFLSKHRIEFFGLKGPKSLQKLILQEEVNHFSKKIKPAYFVLTNVRQDIAKEAGFTKQTSEKRAHYEKKTTK